MLVEACGFDRHSSLAWMVLVPLAIVDVLEIAALAVDRLCIDILVFLPFSCPDSPTITEPSAGVIWKGTRSINGMESNRNHG